MIVAKFVHTKRQLNPNNATTSPPDHQAKPSQAGMTRTGQVSGKVRVTFGIGMPQSTPTPPVRQFRGKPGREFDKLAKILNISVASGGCNCASVEKAMDLAGVEGCRTQRSDFLQRIRDNAKHVDLSQKIVAALTSVTSGLILELGPLALIDPLGAMYDCAMNRAEAVEKEAAENSSE